MRYGVRRAYRPHRSGRFNPSFSFSLTIAPREIPSTLAASVTFHPVTSSAARTSGSGRKGSSSGRPPLFDPSGLLSRGCDTGGADAGGREPGAPLTGCPDAATSLSSSIRSAGCHVPNGS